MYYLVLNFPFEIEGKKSQYTYNTNIERRANLISFALTWKFPIIIDGAACVSISHDNDLYLYIFEFKEINKAIYFMENTSVDVQRVLEFTDVDKLIAKTDKLMAEYEKNEKSYKKKKLVEDNDGFISYKDI